MNRIFAFLRRRDIYLPLVFIGTMSLYAAWRHFSSNVFEVVFATVLSTLLFYASVVAALIAIGWVVKQAALAYGVPLGKWGSTHSLKAFIAGRRRRLAQLVGRGRPLAEGRTQFVLGLALGELGTRDTDTDALRQSAEAFRSALPALHRAGKLEKWALTQSNLAVTLLHLSRREIGKESAAAAVAALRDAADVWERSDNKADWANVQFALCAALVQIGRQEDGTERLAEAVAAGRAALAAEDNSDVPLEDARLKINLAFALAALGERETGAERLEEAAAMARESLRVINSDNGDLLTADETVEWKTEQLSNLGRALRCLGERCDDADFLGEAVETLRSTILLRTDRTAYGWAIAQNQLALALRSLSRCVNEPEQLFDSLSASDAALGILTRKTYPFDWASATAVRANTLATIAGREADTATLRQIVDDLTAAREVFEEAGAPHQHRQCRDDLERARAQLDKALRGDSRGTNDD